MSKTTDDIELDEELLLVYEWRLGRLRHGGFSKRNAELIASAYEIDWRYAVRILQDSHDERLTMKVLF